MDRAAELFRTHERLVRAVCERMVGSADADDIVQDAFIRALTHPPADLSQPIKPWLVKVARNLAIDHLRRRKRYDTVADTGDVTPDDPTDEEPLEGPDDIADLRRAGVAAVLVACEALPPTERGVVLLRDLLELSTRETASVLGLSEGSVKVLHHRARKTLAQRREPASAKMGASTVDALERFVRWLTARGFAGIPVRDADNTDWDGMPDPALSSAGVLRSQGAILRAIVDAARDADRPAVLARALLCRGNLERLAGNLEAACVDLLEATGLAERTGEGDIALRAHSALASTYFSLGQHELARAELVLALGSTALGATSEEGGLRCRLAEILLHQGRIDEADAELERVAELLGRQENHRARLAAAIQRGHHAITVDDYAVALSAWNEALAIARRLGDGRAEAAVRANLGLVHTALADAEVAREELTRAIALAHEVGVVPTEAIAVSMLALLEQDERDLEAAAVRHEQALGLFRALGSRRAEGVTTFNAGVCALLRGRGDQASTLMAAGKAILAEGGPDRMDPYVDAFVAAAALVRRDPGAAEALERARRRAIEAEQSAILRAINVLEAIPEIHAGDLASARARLNHAIPRWVEVRTAIHLVENELESRRPGR